MSNLFFAYYKRLENRRYKMKSSSNNYIEIYYWPGSSEGSPLPSCDIDTRGHLSLQVFERGVANEEYYLSLYPRSNSMNQLERGGWLRAFDHSVVNTSALDNRAHENCFDSDIKYQILYGELSVTDIKRIKSREVVVSFHKGIASLHCLNNKTRIDIVLGKQEDIQKKFRNNSEKKYDVNSYENKKNFYIKDKKLKEHLRQLVLEHGGSTPARKLLLKERKYCKKVKLYDLDFDKIKEKITEIKNTGRVFSQGGSSIFSLDNTDNCSSAVLSVLTAGGLSKGSFIKKTTNSLISAGFGVLGIGLLYSSIGAPLSISYAAISFFSKNIFVPSEAVSLIASYFLNLDESKTLSTSVFINTLFTDYLIYHHSGASKITTLTTLTLASFGVAKVLPIIFYSLVNPVLVTIRWFISLWGKNDIKTEWQWPNMLNDEASLALASVMGLVITGSISYYFSPASGAIMLPEFALVQFFLLLISVSKLLARPVADAIFSVLDFVFDKLEAYIPESIMTWFKKLYSVIKLDPSLLSDPESLYKSLKNHAATVPNESKAAANTGADSIFNISGLFSGRKFTELCTELADNNKTVLENQTVPF